ncbi:MAG: Mur ligase domain-containing protein [Candidatus Saccharibacteria bacterium]|nr:Mur ligase domain-containing protein [Candidatus Saccharibacteria bacterium]
MHVYFAGIGAGTGPLALIAKQAGFDVSGSDKQSSSYTEYLYKKAGITIAIGQTGEELAEAHRKQPIDWLVYSSALPKENPQHPELLKAKELGIKATKRDEFLNELLEQTGQKLIAIAGTHGKSTTTAMMIWLLKELGLSLSYSVGAKLPFGEMGEFNPAAEYFVYEADEYDRNFLSFTPYMGVITGVSYDHQDVYPTQEDYTAAFVQFIHSCQVSVAWDEDGLDAKPQKLVLLHENDVAPQLKLIGLVNRQNAWQVIRAVQQLSDYDELRLVEIMNRFPGLSRRFERLAENIYTDYAHTMEKIRGALQTAHEVAGDNIVVVYEGLHNTRQHFMLERGQFDGLFANIRELIWVPSYLAREDPKLELLSPAQLIERTGVTGKAAVLDESLWADITQAAKNGSLVLLISAGGGGSLDEWARQHVKTAEDRH